MERYPNYLAKHFCKEHTFWTNGYFACSVENVLYYNAYPNNYNNDDYWLAIPESLKVDLKIVEMRISIWGIRIKDLGGDYKSRRKEMNIVMSWLEKSEA